ARTGELLADTAALADFGYGQANCLPHTQLQPVQADAHQHHGSEPNRSVPTVDCAAETPYETWRMAYAIGQPDAGSAPALSSGLTCAAGGRGAVCPAGAPEGVFYLGAPRPRPQCDAPSGEQPAWKGPRRGLVAPLLTLANAGPERFTTDVHGGPGDLVAQ